MGTVNTNRTPAEDRRGSVYTRELSFPKRAASTGVGKFLTIHFNTVSAGAGGDAIRARGDSIAHTPYIGFTGSGARFAGIFIDPSSGTAVQSVTETSEGSGTGQNMSTTYTALYGGATTVEKPIIVLSIGRDVYDSTDDITYQNRLGTFTG